MVRTIYSAFPILLLALSVTTSAAAQAKPPVKPRNSSPQGPGLALQVSLDRAGFSSGEIDGRGGNNTDRALRAFQAAHKLPPTGQVDAATKTALGEAYTNPLATYAISADDAAGPFVPAIPTDMMKKAALPALGYASIKEMLAERFHVNPALLSRLNPGATFKQGEVINVPNVEPFFPSAAAKAAAGRAAAGNATPASADPAPRPTTARPNGAPSGLVITVTDKTKSLQVQDATGTVVFHAPVTVGSKNDPLPVGEWKVNGVQRNPTFNYNPDLFWDANPTHTKAKLPPGPNNPVGAVWIDLSKEHYGIHGTPEPSRIGYTESHGCIRLTNWDATRVAAMVGPGTKVILQ